MESLQLVKEQLKFQSAQLRKAREKKEELLQQLEDFKLQHASEIQTLQEAIDSKDLKIQEEQRKALEAQVAASASRHALTREIPWQESSDTESTEGIHPLDLKRKLDILKSRTQLLREQVEEEKAINEQLNQENSELHRDLKNLQKETRAARELKEKIEALRDQLDQARDSSSGTGEAVKKLVLEKELLLGKYEKILFGDLFPQGKGDIEKEIITDLKEELGDLEAEKERIALELAVLQEDNAQMESKVTLLEEKEAKEEGEYRPDSDSRVAVTSEFFAGLENFLITYSDMITLLLVVFVLLYSISRVDDEKFAEAVSSFQEKELRIEKVNVRLGPEELAMLKRVKELVKDNVDPESLVRSDVRTILLRLKSSDLFAPGSATLLEGAEAIILDTIAEDMKEGVKQVLVDGHTDDVPLKEDSTFPSNWELSAARAAGVARVVIDRMKFPPEQMVVTGYGEYRPFKPNTSDRNRAINRRVEIKILKDKDVAGQEGQKKTGESNLNPKALKLNNSALGAARVNSGSP